MHSIGQEQLSGGEVRPLSLVDRKLRVLGAKRSLATARAHLAKARREAASSKRDARITILHNPANARKRENVKTGVMLSSLLKAEQEKIADKKRKVKQEKQDIIKYNAELSQVNRRIEGETVWMKQHNQRKLNHEKQKKQM